MTHRMEDKGINVEGENCRTKDKKLQKWADALRCLGSAILLSFLLVMLMGFFSFVGECCSRNELIKSVSTVVVTGISDNTVREYSDGDRIYPTEYEYVVFLSDSSGKTTKMQIDRWAPWANTSGRYDSTIVNVGDTVSLYRFGTKGFWRFNGERMVIGKNGRYYE